MHTGTIHRFRIAAKHVHDMRLRISLALFLRAATNLCFFVVFEAVAKIICECLCAVNCELYIKLSPVT